MKFVSTIFRRSAVSAAAAMAAVLSLSAQSEDFNTGKYMEIQSMILRTLQSQYVDTVQLDGLMHKGIDAMLSTLDPYTVFIPEENEEDLDLMTTASYGGVGALIQKTPQGYIIIAEPYENSAAVKAGLHPGDTVVAIEGVSTKDLTADQCSGRMRGRPGTELNMTVVRGRGGDTAQVVLTRERIHIPDVVYYGFLNDSTGYIQIDGSRNTYCIYTQVCQLLCSGKRSVSADNNKSVNSIFLTNRCSLLLSFFCTHLLTAGCLQDRTASLDRIRYISCCQIYDLFIKESLVTSADTSHLDAFP